MAKFEFVLNGDCIDCLEDLPAAAYDSMVTDPPAGINFMSKSWDSNKGGRDQWIAWLTKVMREAKRVLKPGSHCLVWALPRTSHWTATAIENAGFEVRDVITHVFGSGFPKSHNISKGIDKAAGAKRKVVGPSKYANRGRVSSDKYAQDKWTKDNATTMGEVDTAPATDAAKKWDGFGTALKPANEHWILCRIPLTEKTVAKNVLTHGVGGINIDGCRIAGHVPKTIQGQSSRQGEVYGKDQRDQKEFIPNPQGRFPANFILSHSADCELAEHLEKCKKWTNGPNDNVEKWLCDRKCKVGDTDDWNCAPGCPVKELDEQSGERPSRGEYKNRKDRYQVDGHTYKFGGNVENIYANEKGGASRFFYCAKASKRERNAGLAGFEEKRINAYEGGEIASAKTPNSKGGRRTAQNIHPTVKSEKLMRYLTRLVTPPGGKVLDPFCGSGSTGVAAVKEGFEFLGIEKEKEYCEIARARIEHASNEAEGQTCFGFAD